MTLSPVALQALRTAQSAFTGSEADVYEDALARGMEALDGEGRLVGAFQAQELARLEALGVVDAIAKAVRIADDAVSALCREHEENARLRVRIAELEAEQRTTNEVLDDAAEKLRMRERRSASRSGDVTPQVQKLRNLLAGQRDAVDGEHYEHVHHAYRIPHDLPPLDGES